MLNIKNYRSHLRITVILFFLLITVFSFFFGKEYQKTLSSKFLETNKNLESSTSKSMDVSGYYTPFSGDGSTYFLLTQQGNEVSVNGYTNATNLVGDVNIGEFSATTTIDSQGVIKINLSKDNNDYPCVMYLLFYHHITLDEVPPYGKLNDINSIRVFQTNSGIACGFGNNVSFELENQSYEKQKTIPAILPTSKESLP